MDKTLSKTEFVFFGSAQVSVYVLDELKAAGYLPKLIVTYPPKPVGRNLALTENIVAKWAKENSIPTIEEAKLTPEVVEKIKSESVGIDLFIVAAYGRIIPKTIIDLPKHGILNVHPSLLPKYRGPAPILAPILNDEQDNGVSIMLIDEEMDHGPIVSQEKITLPGHGFPIPYQEFEEFMGKTGGKLLAKTIPEWVNGKIKPVEQDHQAATYTKKVNKEDGMVSIEDIRNAMKPADNQQQSKTGTMNPARQLALKFAAYGKWPSLYTFYTDPKTGKQIRLKITSAKYDETAQTFTPIKVIPEGKSETDATRFFV